MCSACIEAGAAWVYKDAPAKSGGTVSGIVFDKRDASIQVKPDGEEKPVTYAIDRSNKQTLKALAGIFPEARVRLVYKTSGETRQLVSIQNTGTTGVVLEPHEWWVEVKPKKCSPEGYAAVCPAEHWKDAVEKIKDLRRGDTVVISYYIDFERHRIRSISKTGK